MRVVLADDHAVLRAGLKALLNTEPDIEVVGEAPDGASAVDAARLSQPDVVVMDIQLPRMSGIDASRAIRLSGLKSKVLILTMHAESEYLLPLLEAGGSGYVLKAGADTELIEAIRTVHRGEVFLYPAATKLFVDRYLDRSTREEEPFDGLTEREREVLKLVAEGYSGKLKSPSSWSSAPKRLTRTANESGRSSVFGIGTNWCDTRYVRGCSRPGRFWLVGGPGRAKTV